MRSRIRFPGGVARPRPKPAIVLVIILAACMPQTPPVDPVPSAVQASGDVFSCVMRSLTELGYAPEAADRASGFIRATKQQPSSFSSGFAGYQQMNILTVTVLPGDTNSELRIAVRTDVTTSDGRTTEGAKTRDVQEAARTVYRSCGA